MCRFMATAGAILTADFIGREYNSRKDYDSCGKE